MNYKIVPHPLNITVEIPPSKSYFQRALICEFLSGEKCIDSNIYKSDDILATHNILNNKKENSQLEMDCKDSASAFRFLVPVMGVLYDENVFLLGNSLSKRPVDEFISIFQKQNIEYRKENNRFCIKGRLKPGDFHLKGNISSQYITGLLFALPLLNEDSRIIVENYPVSKSYIDITLHILNRFGIKIINNNYTEFIVKGKQKYTPCTYTPEGDWSGGAFWHFLKTKYSITIKGLSENSHQPDSIVTKLLPNLPAIFSAENCPDLVPCLTAYAIATEHSIKITDCQRLKYKECDRLSAMNEFKKLGADITTSDNDIIIGKNHSLRRGYVRSFSDHRMIMAYTLFAYLTGLWVETDNINCISKSYPDFFIILNSEE